MSDFVTFRKNEREQVRVSREVYQGHDLVNVRVYYQTADGEMRPTKKGVAIQASQLPELIEALRNFAH